MAAIEAEFLKELQIEPDKSVDVIIRTNPNMTTDDAVIQAVGLTVTRKFSLISALAATGPASAIMALASEPWIESIEPDRAIHTTKSSKENTE